MASVEKELLRAELATSHVFLGGHPSSQIFTSTAKSTFTDTKKALASTAADTAAARRSMKLDSQKQHFQLGAIPRNWSTANAQRDHIAARTEEEWSAHAAEKRLQAFTKKNMQVKHYDLGLNKPEFKSEAQEVFQYDAETVIPEVRRIVKERKSRTKEGGRTHFELGAVPPAFRSEASAQFATPRPEEDKSQTTEKTVPMARTANVMIGLVPVDYTSMAKSVSRVTEEAKAAGEGSQKKSKAEREADRIALQRANWALGLDNMMEEGHYTSQTSLDLWHKPLPPTAGKAAAVRTDSANINPHVIPPAKADNSREWLDALDTMSRRQYQH